MTIKDCIDIVDNVKPNQYSVKDKVMWLSFIEEIIINEVLKTHEGYDGRYDDFEGYTEEKLTVTLIVPSPYDRLYTAYLKMKIDAENGEVARYNNSSALYNTYMLEYRKHYNKTHMPLDSSSKKESAKPSKTTTGITDAEYENLVRDLTFILTEYFSDTISEDKVNEIVTEYMQTNAEMLKGKDGYTPKKGTDYFTEEEIAGVIASAKGDDGYSPVVSVAETAEGHVVTITDAKGTKQFSVTNGKDGVVPKIQADDVNGRHRLVIGSYGENARQVIFWDDGEDGISPTVSVEDTAEGHKVSIHDAEGIKEFDVPDGVGIESVYQSVVSPDDNGNNVITLTLTDGSQTTFKVKNGSKGSKGDKGDALTYEDLTEANKADLLKDVYKKADTYSKKEVDNKFGDVYSKNEVYNKDEVYNKGDIDYKLISYMNVGDVNSLVGHHIAGVVDNAPNDLNTLNKIASAIGDDPYFSNTISMRLNNKADADNVYSKSEADSKVSKAVSSKADKVDVYTKDEVDEKISAEVSSVDISKAANAFKGNVSGEIVSFSDVSPIVHDIKVKVSGGSDVRRCGKNLLPYPYYHTTRTAVGITFTDNGDGTITANGTATTNNAAGFYLVRDTFPLKDGTTYYLPDLSSKGLILRLMYQDENGTTKYATKSLTWSNAYTFDRLYIDVPTAGIPITNVVIKPYISVVADAEYEKYNGKVFTADNDGNVKIPSLYPTTVLFTETDGAVIEAEYNKDLNKVFGDIDEALDMILAIQEQYLPTEVITNGGEDV